MSGSFCFAVAADEARARAPTQSTGAAEDEWWYENSAELERAWPDFGERSSSLTRMAEEDAFTNDDESRPHQEQHAWQTLQFGLQSLLGGAAGRLPEAGDRCGSLPRCAGPPRAALQNIPHARSASRSTAVRAIETSNEPAQPIRLL